MSATTTVAPQRVSKRAVARPIPEAPPVTMATLSFMDDPFGVDRRHLIGE
jgi:hypothetical protein